MRSPDPFATTMNGLWSSLLMSVVENLANEVIADLNLLSLGPFQPVADGLVGLVGNLLTWVTGVVFPGAPGAINWLTAGPEGMVTLAKTTSDTLWTHHGWMRWIADALLPQYIAGANALSWRLYEDGRTYSADLLGVGERYTDVLINGMYDFVVSTRNALQATERRDIASVTTFINQVQAALKSTIAAYVEFLTAEIAKVAANAKASLDQAVSSLSHAITVAKLEGAAALAAAVAFITTMAIPDALVAYTATQAAALAAATDVLWPLVDEATGSTALQLATTLPAVAEREADVPPELVPGVPGLGEGVAAALGFVTAVQSQACAPLWRKLHQVAEDESEISGIMGTLVLGGLAVAAIAAPATTATAVADAIAVPIDLATTGILGMLGLGDLQVAK